MLTYSRTDRTIHHQSIHPNPPAPTAKTKEPQRSTMEAAAIPAATNSLIHLQAVTTEVHLHKAGPLHLVVTTNNSLCITNKALHSKAISETRGEGWEEAL